MLDVLPFLFPWTFKGVNLTDKFNEKMKYYNVLYSSAIFFSLVIMADSFTVTFSHLKMSDNLNSHIRNMTRTDITTT